MKTHSFPTQETGFTPGEWQVTIFTDAEGKELDTPELMAAIQMRSTMCSIGTRLYGITVKDDPTDPPRVVCYTGNGPTSEGNARLIATSPQLYDELFRALAVITNPQAFDVEQVRADIQKVLAKAHKGSL